MTSRYAPHDSYIRKHYHTKGPSAIGMELGLPKNGVISRYHFISGNRRPQKVKTVRREIETPSIPRVTLDR